jgi:stage V sporulation protein AE
MNFLNELLKTDFLISYLKAFLVGGAICGIGQILIDKTSLTPAKILVAFVSIGVLLGAVGVYEPLVEFAGSGATVPLTGFGYNISRGVKEAVADEGLVGIINGGLCAASAGITVAVISGLICSIVTKSKDKS